MIGETFSRQCPCTQRDFGTIGTTDDEEGGGGGGVDWRKLFPNKSLHTS